MRTPLDYEDRDKETDRQVERRDPERVYVKKRSTKPLLNGRNVASTERDAKPQQLRQPELTVVAQTCKACGGWFS